MNLIFSRFSVFALLGTVLVSGAGVYAMTARHKPAAGSAVPQQAALTVVTARPRQVSWEQTLTASGSVAAWQEAVIASEIGGLRVTRMAADVGSMVHGGQVVAELAQDTIDATVRQQQARVAVARAAQAEAQANADRARLVQQTGALSAQQIDQYLTAERAAVANLALAVAGLRGEMLRLSQTRILAPDDGIISSRSATLGSVPQPGAELFRLVRQGRLEWRAEVTAANLAKINPEQHVSIRLTNGASVTGSVRIAAPTLDVHSRKALVYVDLPPGSSARAGMFATGEIRLGASAATVLPASAIVLRDGFSYVFAVNAKNVVAQLKVDTGRRQGKDVEILAGLPANSRVVSQGGAFLNGGDSVRVESAPKVATPGAGT